MHAPQQLSALAIDLTRVYRRTVTSFYSNLVTRPTGRAVRMGVEQQLAEVIAAGRPCLSVLDFSQVRVLDYSCADEIVAKLLLRFVEARERQANVYFLARGLQEHHIESVEAVLDRHGLLLAAETRPKEARLLGPASDEDRRCWEVLVRHGRVRVQHLAERAGLPAETLAPTLTRLLHTRVAVPLPGEVVGPVPQLDDV